MTFYKNMTIKAKLLTCFLTIAIISALVGGTGFVGVGVLNANEHLLYTSGLLGVKAAGGMYAGFAEQRVTIRGMMLFINDSAKAEREIANLRAREAEFEQVYREYLGTMLGSSGEDQIMLQKVMEIYNGEYKTLKEQFVTAVAAGDEAGAWAAFNQLAPPIENGSAMLTQMMDYNSQMSSDQNDADARTASVLSIASGAMTLILVIVAVLLGLYNARVIARPISNMAAAAKALSEGDVDVNLDINSKDEVGMLATAFNDMVDGIHEQADIVRAIADGDYTVSVPIRSDKDVMNQALANMVSSGSNMMSDINAASSQVNAGSQQISQGAQGLAAGTSQQASSIEELSATIAEIKEQVDESAVSSQRALNNCEVAGSMMAQSMDSMDQMLKAMAIIGESSKSITQVIKVIDDIAFQTNILALNAAVEAARAGQHGKGFAVVADEVRNLAAKSAEASKETAALIEGSIVHVSEGSKIVERTSEGLRSVSESSADTANIVRGMADSLSVQARAIGEINQGIEQVAIVVQSNAATAEQSAAASEELSAQAVVLNEIISHFKIDNKAGVAANTNAAQTAAASMSQGFALSADGSKY